MKKRANLATDVESAYRDAFGRLSNSACKVQEQVSDSTLIMLPETNPTDFFGSSVNGSTRENTSRYQNVAPASKQTVFIRYMQSKRKSATKINPYDESHESSGIQGRFDSVLSEVTLNQDLKVIV